MPHQVVRHRPEHEAGGAAEATGAGNDETGPHRHQVVDDGRTRRPHQYLGGVRLQSQLPGGLGHDRVADIDGLLTGGDQVSGGQAGGERTAGHRPRHPRIDDDVRHHRDDPDRPPSAVEQGQARPDGVQRDRRTVGATDHDVAHDDLLVAGCLPAGRSRPSPVPTTVARTAPPRVAPHVPPHGSARLTFGAPRVPTPRIGPTHVLGPTRSDPTRSARSRRQTPCRAVRWIQSRGSGARPDRPCLEASWTHPSPAPPSFPRRCGPTASPATAALRSRDTSPPRCPPPARGSCW
ncbi:hypothetical protein SDC9_115594 [bioreactor metagenome]|uniref:Uncharacterized protein n=1 Tax=bioreactor metagenome TaxID=1076179 RepID=A0A645BTA7_9ZZZZ